MNIPDPRIDLWVPNLQPYNDPHLGQVKGGIQVYVNVLLDSLQTLYPNFHYRVFSKHDAGFSAETHIHQQIQFRGSGAWPLKLRTPIFATTLVRYSFWQRPNLIISTHPNFAVVADWLKQTVGIPYWIVAHGVDAWNIQRPALKQAFKHADRILAVSGYTRDRLLKEQDLKPEQVLVLPNTFDPSQFHIAPKPDYLLKRYGLSSTQPLILTVGRLSSSEQYKGYDQILQTLPIIQQSIPDVHYLLVGKGDDQARIEALIQRLNLQKHVTLAGFVPDKELCDHYNLCDVFAMPSKGEGFGIVYLEALACGKPTLGGNQDGALDALCQGRLGALVNPDDVEEIATTLIQILQGRYSHPIMYQPEKLRQEVINTFGIERFRQTLTNLIATQILSIQGVSE